MSFGFARSTERVLNDTRQDVPEISLAAIELTDNELAAVEGGWGGGGGGCGTGYGFGFGFGFGHRRFWHRRFGHRRFGHRRFGHRRFGHRR
ncbi:bacteriocin [Dictyobacter arantiisoli]|uniref:Uncharacterized protein n=1 Tax=Dictyobacter arantiisoli TaxID=2014874 RepID=A0A5A5TAN9_9CHLR|nr:bacteriocin [Dictyobacter arantiisoli]GCF08468.1 hypothetical protein KDI_20320 [Dictyobacter arantiisoli]